MHPQTMKTSTAEDRDSSDATPTCLCISVARHSSSDEKYEIARIIWGICAKHGILQNIHWNMKIFVELPHFAIIWLKVIDDDEVLYGLQSHS